MLQTIPTSPLQLVEPASQRERMKERAAFCLYEALRLPTMPAYYDASSRTRNRFRNAISMAERAIDMAAVVKEGK
jgi:2-polyprenyl-6-methoxyphenol hydroxylase-like FAD-dependent oxidoreductase